MPPTQKQIQDSVEATMNVVSRRGDELVGLLQEAESIIGVAGDVREQHTHVIKIANAISCILKDHVVCMAGCSHCCNMAVSITAADAEIIGYHIGVAPAPVPADIHRDAQVEKYQGVPCPFLFEGACSIYEVRPVACRTHFNLSAYPEVCDMEAMPGQEVCNLNMAPVWAATASIAVMADLPVGDIREFFPEGATPSLF